MQRERAEPDQAIDRKRSAGEEFLEYGNQVKKRSKSPSSQSRQSSPSPWESAEWDASSAGRGRCRSVPPQSDRSYGIDSYHHQSDANQQSSRREPRAQSFHTRRGVDIRRHNLRIADRTAWASQPDAKGRRSELNQKAIEETLFVYGLDCPTEKDGWAMLNRYTGGVLSRIELCYCNIVNGSARWRPQSEC